MKWEDRSGVSHNAARSPTYCLVVFEVYEGSKSPSPSSPVSMLALSSSHEDCKPTPAAFLPSTKSTGAV